MIWSNEKGEYDRSEGVKRVVKRFAWLPTKVDEPSKHTVWLSSYYVTQEWFQTYNIVGAKRYYWLSLWKAAWHPNDWIEILENSKPKGWIGFDLDGTLAIHERGDRRMGYVGPPIKKAIKRVRKYLARGWDVKIVTARVGTATPEEIKKIEEWCLIHIGQVLPIVGNKDGSMVALFDDRAVGVESNTGELLNGFGDD